MISIRTMPETDQSDAELVAQTLAGNRNAFGRIVARYQNLVCSLAYSATGNLAQSQDLSQETFVTAWKQLAELREPGKLRPWLCGILRNLCHRNRRGREHEPLHAAEPLDAAAETPAIEAHPRDQVISREEEDILWRSLERVPETYREPLILFYREKESVEQVARDLACGGLGLANHVNDSVAHAFFVRHPLLDFTRGESRDLFWLLCFGPMFVQMTVWIWWRRRMERRPKQN